ncbi:hypothetical protein ZWY2020_040403 [Hordeum vulgare]|nr:hypothetical protein ZWY2020_040403 [Hordeum vulgare]
MEHAPVRHTLRSRRRQVPSIHLQSYTHASTLPSLASVNAATTPHNPIALRSFIQPHSSLRSSCTMPPILVVIEAVDTTSLLLPTSPPLPRWCLHGGYNAQDAAAAQSSLTFGLSSGRCSEVDRRDLNFASRKGNNV